VFIKSVCESGGGDIIGTQESLKGIAAEIYNYSTNISDGISAQEAICMVNKDVYNYSIEKNGVIRTNSLSIKDQSRSPESTIGLAVILSELGYDVSINGVFDEKLKIAVTEFQNSRGLNADGVVGVKTKDELITVLSEKLQVPLKREDNIEKFATNKAMIISFMEVINSILKEEDIHFADPSFILASMIDEHGCDELKSFKKMIKRGLNLGNITKGDRTNLSTSWVYKDKKNKVILDENNNSIAKPTRPFGTNNRKFRVYTTIKEALRDKILLLKTLYPKIATLNSKSEIAEIQKSLKGYAETTTKASNMKSISKKIRRICNEISIQNT